MTPPKADPKDQLLDAALMHVPFDGWSPATFNAAIKDSGLDPALAVLRLTRRFSAARVEAACQIALRGPVRSPRYAHLRPILDTGQDKLAEHRPPPEDAAGGYVRGSDYYAGGLR